MFLGVSSKESDSITFLAKTIILLLDFSHSFFLILFIVVAPKKIKLSEEADAEAMGK